MLIIGQEFVLKRLEIILEEIELSGKTKVSIKAEEWRDRSFTLHSNFSRHLQTKIEQVVRSSKSDL